MIEETFGKGAFELRRRGSRKAMVVDCNRSEQVAVVRNLERSCGRTCCHDHMSVVTPRVTPRGQLGKVRELEDGNKISRFQSVLSLTSC